MTRTEAHVFFVSMMTEMFQIGEARLGPETKLEDLDLDSIDAIDMAVKLQQKTGRRVDEEALKSLRTVADVELLIQGHFGGDA